MEIRKLADVSYQRIRVKVIGSETKSLRNALASPNLGISRNSMVAPEEDRNNSGAAWKYRSSDLPREKLGIVTSMSLPEARTLISAPSPTIFSRVERLIASRRYRPHTQLGTGELDLA